MTQVWCGTMLCAYSSLPKIVKNIEKSVDCHVKSGFMSRHFEHGISTEQLFERICTLNERKSKLINLKVLVDRATSTLDRSEKNLLYLRFVDRWQLRELAERENVVQRTIIRRIDRALDKMARALHRMGFDEQWFENQYGSDMFVQSIRHKLEKCGD